MTMERFFEDKLVDLIRWHCQQICVMYALLLHKVVTQTEESSSLNVVKDNKLKYNMLN